MNRYGLSYLVAEEILNKVGKFTKTDIFAEIKQTTNNISDDFLWSVINAKILELCDLGLIFGGGDIFYSINFPLVKR